MDLGALKTELAAGHPETGAYSADNRVAAAELGAVNRSLPRAAMTASEVLNAIEQTALDALPATEKTRIWNVLHLGTINPFGIEADLFVSVFGAASATITALKAARNRPVSRAVELGLGEVKEGHVQMARE